MSEQVVSNTGAPQGTVLSLFRLPQMAPFSDDSAIVGCQWWTGDREQGTDGPLCGMMWEQPPSLKCDQDKGDGCGF